VLLAFTAVSAISQTVIAYTAPLWAVAVVPAVLLPVAIALLMMIPRARYSGSS